MLLNIFCSSNFTHDILSEWEQFKFIKHHSNFIHLAVAAPPAGPPPPAAPVKIIPNTGPPSLTPHTDVEVSDMRRTIVNKLTQSKVNTSFALSYTFILILIRGVPIPIPIYL